MRRAALHWFRVLAVLAGFVLPSLASAKGMVIVYRLQNSGFSTAVTNRQTWQSDYSERMAREVLDRFNVSYTVIPLVQARTEYARIGAQTWNKGTSAATAETFQWVLHVNYPGKLAKSGRWPWNIRPDSLHMSALGGCTVPQLFWNMQLNGATPAAFLADTTGDATGFTTGTVALGGPGGCQVLPYSVHHTGSKFFEVSYVAVVNAAGDPISSVNGGFRVLHARRAGQSTLTTGIESAEGLAAQTVGWADSNAAFATDNSGVQVWEMPFSHISTAKPLVFAQVWGTSGCTDSTGTTTATPCEGDVQNMLLSLARVDSLTSGGVFGRSLGLGVIIKGGFKRSGVGNPGGISPADTTALKGTLDSLATLGSRFRCLVTADMDSVWARTSDKTWWEKLPGMKYTPTAEACVYDSTQGQCRGVSGSKWLIPMDVYGKFKKRIAVGPYSDTTLSYNFTAFAASSNPDSSISFMVRSLFFHADSTFGRDRVSRFLVPPGDDWSPPSAVIPDSVVLALQKSGAVGLLFNSQRRTVPSEMRGYPSIGEERITNSLTGKPFLLLGYSGASCNGGRRTFDVREDSTNWAGAVCQSNGFNKSMYTYPALAPREAHRALYSLVFRTYRDLDMMMRARYVSGLYDDVTTPADDRTYGLRRGSVWVTNAQELGGGGHGAAGYAPTRTAWWTIKSLDQFMLALNKQAGRTVMKWEWPENIVP